ncbi:unnamed protein product [Cunninghamella blakesleeana]
MEQNDIIDINSIEGIGEEAWHKRRQLWITPSSSTSSNNDTSTYPMETITENLKELTLPDSSKLQIYQSLIIERRAFKKSIPLGTVIDVIVHGWKKNGTWDNN